MDKKEYKAPVNLKSGLELVAVVLDKEKTKTEDERRRAASALEELLRLLLVD